MSPSPAGLDRSYVPAYSNRPPVEGVIRVMTGGLAAAVRSPAPPGLPARADLRCGRPSSRRLAKERVRQCSDVLFAQRGRATGRLGNGFLLRYLARLDLLDSQEGAHPALTAARPMLRAPFRTRRLEAVRGDARRLGRDADLFELAPTASRATVVSLTRSRLAASARVSHSAVPWEGMVHLAARRLDLARPPPEHGLTRHRPFRAIWCRSDRRPLLSGHQAVASVAVAMPASHAPPVIYYLHRHVTASGFRDRSFSVWGRASLCSLALIAAGSCERAAGSGGAERPRSGAAGALDAAARERIRGWRGRGSERRGSRILGWRMPFFRGLR